MNKTIYFNKKIKISFSFKKSVNPFHDKTRYEFEEKRYWREVFKLMEYFICPVPKPRMSNRDKFLHPPRPPVQRYWNFVDQCRLERVVIPCFSVHVIFILPMPASWSKKKKAQTNGKPHMQKPDLDNLLKALGDAIYHNDSGIHDIWVTKRWGVQGKILVKEIKCI